jgi:DNA segregation ATPase FtsK/SpoIIIE, S-DNA-T family
MGSINLQIAALHNDSAANAPENPHAPQALAPSPVLPARGVSTAPPPTPVQDTVSLSGTLLPQQRQQNAPSAGNAQPATFTLLTQTTTFPASQNDAAATPPTIQSNAPTVAVAAPAQAPAAQSPVAKAPASANATATAVTASSAAPAQQTLQQLDRVLQQLGIDPQTLSLISREGMLNWVNDPAALRQIVQNVQAAANSSQQNAAVGSTNPAQTAAQLAIASANQNQIQSPQTQNQPQAAARESNPVSASSTAASNNNTNALDQSAATAQQNATAVAQFQKLQDSLAPSGTTEAQPAATSSGTTTPQGQLLNVSA